MVNKLIKKAAAYVVSATLAFGVFSAAGIGAPVDVQAARKKVKTIKFKKKGYVLSKKGKKINLSKQLTFNPKKPNTKKVYYKTSSKKIATVSSKGIVKAKKTGTVTITATSKSNKKAKATTKITVGKGVKSLKFKEGTKRTVKVTEGFYLHPSYSPGNATTRSVTYKSSNTKVATVSSKGYISAKAAGTAKITAACKDAYGKTATMYVTVPACVTGISLDYSKLQMKKGESEQSLSAKVSGSSSGVTYKWTSSNSKVATVSGNGKTANVKAQGTGTAVIQVEAYNSNNAAKNHKYAKCTVSVGTVPTQTITTNGTYDSVKKDVVIKGSATGGIVINDANINTLTLEPGAYAVNLNDCNVRTLVTTETKSSVLKAKAALTQPVLNLNGTIIKNAVISTGMSVDLQSESASITNLTMNTRVQLSAKDDASYKNVTVATTEPVTISAPINKLTVTKASQVTVESEVRKLTLDCGSGRPVIDTTKDAKIDKLVVTEGTPQASIIGDGTIGVVQVPDVKDSFGKDKINININNEVKVEDNKGGSDVIHPFENVTPEVKDGFKTYTLSSDAYKYRVIKGSRKAYLENSDLEKALKYLANPADAYKKWTGLNGTYVDESGMVTVKGQAGETTKEVIIKADSSKDGTYKVKLEEITSGTEYKATVTYPASANKSDSDISIKVTGDTVTAISGGGQYTATAKTNGTSFEVKKGNQTLVKAVKDADSYKLSIAEEKTDGIEIAQQLKK